MPRSDPTYEQIILEVEDPIATITLNRPEALNAWTDEMGVELRDAFARAERDPSVVGIIFTGAGRGFCAGADMKVLTDLAGDSPETFVDTTPMPGDASWGDDLRGAYTYMLSVPKPVVCVINGPVAGMGLPLALACDLRFMNVDAVMTTAFAHRGLIAELGVSWFLTRLVGPAHALDLLYTARKVGGEEAERLGLVNRALPAGEVMEAARDYVQGLADLSSPTSMAVMKRQVYTQLHAGLAAAQEEADLLMKESFARPDFAEGVRAFLDRRPPAFDRLGDV